MMRCFFHCPINRRSQGFSSLMARIMGKELPNSLFGWTASSMVRAPGIDVGEGYFSEDRVYMMPLPENRIPFPSGSRIASFLLMNVRGQRPAMRIIPRMQRQMMPRWRLLISINFWISKLKPHEERAYWHRRGGLTYDKRGKISIIVLRRHQMGGKHLGGKSAVMEYFQCKSISNVVNENNRHYYTASWIREQEIMCIEWEVGSQKKEVSIKSKKNHLSPTA